MKFTSYASNLKQYLDKLFPLVRSLLRRDQKNAKHNFFKEAKVEAFQLRLAEGETAVKTTLSNWKERR